MNEPNDNCGFTPKWMRDTKAMVNRGFTIFCKEHKIKEVETWSEQIAADVAASGRRRRGRPSAAETEARKACEEMERDNNE